MKQYVGAFLLQFASCNICKNQSSWEKFTAKSSGVCTKSWYTLLRGWGQISPRFFLMTMDRVKPWCADHLHVLLLIVYVCLHNCMFSCLVIVHIVGMLRWWLHIWSTLLLAGQARLGLYIALKLHFMKHKDFTQQSCSARDKEDLSSSHVNVCTGNPKNSSW